MMGGNFGAWWKDRAIKIFSSLVHLRNTWKSPCSPVWPRVSRGGEGGCGGWSGGKSLAWAAFEGKSDQLINWRWHWAKWLAGCGKMRETKDNWTFSTQATLIATFSTQALELHALLAWAIGGALAWAIGGAQRKITKLSLLLFKFHPTICFWACFVLCVRRFSQI